MIALMRFDFFKKIDQEYPLKIINLDPNLPVQCLNHILRGQGIGLVPQSLTRNRNQGTRNKFCLMF